MAEATLHFTREEYAARLEKTQRAMAAADLELLIISDPSNMYWLTGYDGWSFYVHQAVIVPVDDTPIWFGRGQDANGAVRTAWLPHDRLVPYPDHYVQSLERHPMDLLSQVLRDRGLGTRRIAVEMDNYYFSAAAFAALQKGLPDARFADARGLVNWQRAKKSSREIGYMRKAARIVEAMHARIFDVIEPGMAKNALVAEIFHAGASGVEGIGGDYAAIVPLVMAGSDAAAPHLTWDEKPLRAEEGVSIEIAGCYRRYHAPLCRTVFLGTPTAAFREAEKALTEGIAAGLEQARPGRQCQDVANAFLGVLKKYGIEKTSRCGYAIGLSYPPDWGERTMSLRPGDESVLEAGMTFHFMPGLWFDDWGMEITESILIGETGAECLADVPRRLIVKN
jgi:ectoine hydrolase